MTPLGSGRWLTLVVGGRGPPPPRPPGGEAARIRGGGGCPIASLEKDGLQRNHCAVKAHMANGMWLKPWVQITKCLVMELIFYVVKEYLAQTLDPKSEMTRYQSCCVIICSNFFLSH